MCAAFEQNRPRDASTLASDSPGTNKRKRRTCGVRSGTKFARYDVCHGHLSASHVREHALSEAHCLAVKAHLAPDTPVRILLQTDMDDEQLLRGAVPQPADWLRAWRVCMKPCSWREAAKSSQTDHYVAQIREHSVKPQAIQSMVSCMKEALRMRKREWLREATYIFVGFDDKNGRKLLRFKCDAPTAAGRSASTPERDSTWLRYGARIGVVGCMPAGLNYGLDDYERDYAERTCEEVIKLLQRLCAPAGDTSDTTLFEDVLRKIAGVVVDGALLKTARYMKAYRFPNIVIIMRDPAHIIRPSCRDPLHDADKFGEQYERLFGQRHAVLKDFMNSVQWQDQLEKAQRELARTGASTPCLKSVLRHVDFVQPRFESFVTPRRRYVCLLRAIATVLAIKAGDDRLGAGVQRRADEALKIMAQSADCFVAGLAGDYGEVCLEFLRYFDVRDHDPARTFQQVQEFIRTLRQLFVQGYVLCSEGMTEVPGLGVRKTLSQIAVDNMEEPLILTYGRRSWSLWSTRIEWQDVTEALAAISGVAKDVIDRLKAEFHEQDLYMAYRAFDLDAWATLVSASTPDASTKGMEAALKKIGAALEATADWNTWRRAARVAIRARVGASTPDANSEYRLAWRAAIDDPGFPAPLIKVVRFYFATWDGTGAVERGLGQDAAIQKQHVGPRARDDLDADLYSALLELHEEGPRTEAEMFKSIDGVLHFTEFSRACAQQWVLQHGRRFTCYKVRKDKGSRRPQRRKGTDRGVQLLARAAYKTQCTMAEVDHARASKLGKPPRRQTVLGVDRAKLMFSVSALAAPAAGKKTRDFRAATAKKRAEKQASEAWCGWGSTVPKPRLGGGAAVEAATRSAATQAVRARLWLSARDRRQAAACKRGGGVSAASASTSSSSTEKVQATQKRKVQRSDQAVSASSGTWKRRKTSSCPLKSSSASTTGPKSSSAGSKSSRSSMPGTKSPSAGASAAGQPSVAMCRAVAAKFAKKTTALGQHKFGGYGQTTRDGPRHHRAVVLDEGCLPGRPGEVP